VFVIHVSNRLNVSPELQRAVDNLERRRNEVGPY